MGDSGSISPGNPNAHFMQSPNPVGGDEGGSPNEKKGRKRLLSPSDVSDEPSLKPKRSRTNLVIPTEASGVSEASVTPPVVASSAAPSGIEVVQAGPSLEVDSESENENSPGSYRRATDVGAIGSLNSSMSNLGGFSSTQSAGTGVQSTGQSTVQSSASTTQSTVPGSSSTESHSSDQGNN